MNQTALAVAFGSFLLWPPCSLMSAPVPRGGSRTLAEMRESAGDLRKDLSKMESLEDHLDKVQQDEQTKILGALGRRTLGTDIGMNLRILHNYQAEAWQEVAYLKDHWRRLTRDERELVDQARIDLQQDKYEGP